ncbi:CMRF35-like molecule 5 [Alosa sapidissima]|uniref:CMRF35-like molecule 5 n=1 Tax=Alosa sapidissima TaxID=34773 RepID=UPI001C0984C3|nr:CMRF35-like molecule 5 [Alosa sapidissima]
MRMALRILCLYFVQAGVLTAPIHVSGTEGGRVELTCPYPDQHIYTPKYFCRESCIMWSDVLITSEKAGDGVTKGRYFALDTTSARTFCVIIKNLQLGDAGVYYCGLNQWGSDTKTKVVLTVSKAPTPVSPLSTTSPPTHLQDTTNSILPPTGSVIGLLHIGVILGLLLCGVLALIWVEFVHKPASLPLPFTTTPIL